MMAAAQDCAAAVAEFLAGGGDAGAPLAVTASQAVGALEDLAAMARCLDVGEAVIEAERARAVAEDRAAWPRGRGHLRAVR
jgi:hypothetical protein